MNFGFVYKNSLIYNLLLWILYKGNPHKRFSQVAAEIPEGASVLDLCAGTDLLYRQLKGKVSSYKAFDLNPKFVEEMRRAGIDAEIADVLTKDFPNVDVIVMNSSLYHFGPDVSLIMNKMLSNAKDKVIILEPVKNNSSSKFSILSSFTRWASAVDGKVPSFYFDSKTFETAMNIYKSKLLKLSNLSNGRDMIAVLKA